MLLRVSSREPLLLLLPPPGSRSRERENTLTPHTTSLAARPPNPQLCKGVHCILPQHPPLPFTAIQLLFLGNSRLWNALCTGAHPRVEVELECGCTNHKLIAMVQGVGLTVLFSLHA